MNAFARHKNSSASKCSDSPITHLRCGLSPHRNRSRTSGTVDSRTANSTSSGWTISGPCQRRFSPANIHSRQTEAYGAGSGDRSDVSEEIQRLRIHSDQLGTLLTSGGEVGKKLDFLLQEMNREINTVGSKAAEHPIAARVVEMKSVLERMREQAANVE